MRQLLDLCILRPKPEPTETKSLPTSPKGEEIGASLDPPRNDPQDPKVWCTSDVSFKTEQDASWNSLDQRCEQRVEEVLEPTISKRDQQSHTCSYCGKSFSRPRNLRTHVRRVHLTQRRFTCEYCEKSFAQNGGLRSHLRSVHLHQRPHTCEVCEKSFTRSDHLNLHRRSVHWHQRPHTCELCQKSYAQKGYLQEHIRTVHLNQRPHTYLRPHHCDRCYKSFSDKSSLREHVKAIHLEKSTDETLLTR